MAKASMIPATAGASTTAAAGTVRAPVRPDAPWAWLAAGWRDLWRVPGISLAYGLLLAGVSGFMTWMLFGLELQYLLMPMVAGFMLVGPMLAVGLYETSRRLDAGEPTDLASALFVSTRSPAKLAFLGALLMLMLLAFSVCCCH